MNVDDPSITANTKFAFADQEATSFRVVMVQLNTIFDEYEDQLCEEKIEAMRHSLELAGLINPVRLTEDHRIIVGRYRCASAKRIGWTHIAAIIVQEDELQKELKTAEENLLRRKLTVLERSELLFTRKQICKVLSSKENHQGGSGEKQGKKERNKFATGAAAMLGVDRRTIEQEVQIARNLTEENKNIIRTTPLANRKNKLLMLSRLSPQEQSQALKNLLEELASGSRRNKRSIAQKQEQSSGQIAMSTSNDSLSSPESVSTSSCQLETSNHQYELATTPAEEILKIFDHALQALNWEQTSKVLDEKIHQVLAYLSDYFRRPPDASRKSRSTKGRVTKKTPQNNDQPHSHLTFSDPSFVKSS